jgi:hypothetical protein
MIIDTLIEYKNLTVLKKYLLHLMSPIFTVCLCKTRKLTIFKRNYFISKLQGLWFVCMILFTQFVLAQYTNVINSNRPGFSESPYSVGTGVYQLETSIFFRKTSIYPTFSRPESYGADFLFRTSFFQEKLELNLNFAYQNEQVSFQNIFNSSYNKTGFSKLTVGAKYLVYEQKHTDKSKEIRSWVARNKFDWKRLIPSVAAYAGVNTGIPEDIYKTNNFSPKAGILLQNDLTNNFNIITNIYYDRIGTELPEFSYIITATFSYNNRWSIFIENQTMLDKIQAQSNIGSGIAFLYNRNIQINSSLRLLTDAKSSGFYSSIGASYRFDRHIDKVTELDENGKPVKNDKSFNVKEKKLFGRLFGKVRNVFKKKGKKQASGTSKLRKKTVESINKNSTNSNNDDEVKPLRIKPKRTRVKSSKIKPTKDKTKKGFLGILKGKKNIKDDLKKDTDKGTKELEKEIKKLEKEVRKEEAKTDKKTKKDSKKLEKERKKDEARKKKDEAKKNKGKKENDNDTDTNRV